MQEDAPEWYLNCWELHSQTGQEQQEQEESEVYQTEHQLEQGQKNCVAA